jgi:hypothetical protein
MKGQMMNKQQLELGFDGTVVPAPARRPDRPVLGVAWWFGQMRRVVDAAVEWRPTPPARPEQTQLRLASGPA